MPETTKKSKSKLLLILIPIIAVAAVLIIVFAVVLPKAKAAAYNKAAELMENEKYAEAQAEFEKLGEYEDSAEQAEVNENYIIAEEKYEKALKEYDAKNWEAAKEGFQEVSELADSSLPSPYKDTKKLIEDCDQHITYEQAAALAQDEENLTDISEALLLFRGLGDFEDAEARADACQVIVENAEKYQQAEEAFADKKYAESKAAYDSLGDYKDSKDKAETCAVLIGYEEVLSLYNGGSYEDALAAAEALEKDHSDTGTVLSEYGTTDLDTLKADCQQIIETNNTYKQAEEYFGNKNYAEAKELYDSLGDHEDSADKSEMCVILTDFEAAYALYEEGQNTKALEATAAIEEAYSNAGTVINEYSGVDLDTFKNQCEAEKTLNSAKKKLNNGDYAGAKEKLDAIDTDYLREESKSDVSEMRQTILSEEEYQKAVDLYNSGRYYDAMLALRACGDYKDAAALADACVQPFPGDGVVYMNEAYGDRSSELTIDNSGYMNAYYKLYFDDDLVMTVSILENSSATFALPAGNYRMTKAYGNTWYGTIDMFGDEGYYWICDFGGSEIAPIEAGYGYIISSGGEGTGIGTTPGSRGSI